jgi:hypothetical protein
VAALSLTNLLDLVPQFPELDAELKSKIVRLAGLFGVSDLPRQIQLDHAAEEAANRTKLLISEFQGGPRARPREHRSFDPSALPCYAQRNTPSPPPPPSPPQTILTAANTALATHSSTVKSEAKGLASTKPAKLTPMEKLRLRMQAKFDKREVEDKEQQRAKAERKEQEQAVRITRHSVE